MASKIGGKNIESIKSSITKKRGRICLQETSQLVFPITRLSRKYLRSLYRCKISARAAIYHAAIYECVANKLLDAVATMIKLKQKITPQHIRLAIKQVPGLQDAIGPSFVMQGGFDRTTHFGVRTKKTRAPPAPVLGAAADES